LSLRPECAVKIVFMGTSDFAGPSLRALVESGQDVAAVFTQPDRPAGRGRRVCSSPVKQAAAAAGVEIHEPLRPNGPRWVDKLRQIAPDLIVVAAYGHILRPAVLDTPRLGCINLHASLLPRHRGASPIAAAILAGDAQTGVTIIRMVPRMDAGDIIAQRAVAVGPDQTAGELHDVLAGLAAELLLEVLNAYQQGKVVYTPQDEGRASYCAKLTKASGRIGWDAPAEMICRQIRAMTPWPGAHGELNGQRMTVLRALPRGGAGGEPGVVLAAGREGIAVAARDGIVAIERLQPASGRPMSAAEYLNGRPVRPGDRFADVG